MEKRASLLQKYITLYKSTLENNKKNVEKFFLMRFIIFLLRFIISGYLI